MGHGGLWVHHAQFGPLGILAASLPPIDTIYNHDLIKEAFLNKS